MQNSRRIRLRWGKNTEMPIWISRVLTAFSFALALVFLTGNSGTLAVCDINAQHMGTISCGDIKNPLGLGGSVWFIFEFEANAGDIIAFTASYEPDGGTLALAVQDTTCAITYVSDGNESPVETAFICPFVAPETSTYILYISAIGRRLVPFSLSMACLDTVDDCATVPVEKRTWGHTKTRYQ